MAGVAALLVVVAVAVVVAGGDGTPAPGVDSVHLGDPARNVGVYRQHGSEDVHIVLDRAAPRRLDVRYRIVDHVGAEVAAGTARVARGAAAATVELPDLPPGHYRVTARPGSSSGPDTVGSFARLPEQQAVRGRANRFGVNTFVMSTVPRARRPAVAAAMAAMGAGWVREAAPGEDVIPTFHDHGLAVVEVIVPAPSWDITAASDPLPDDLRDAHRTARSLADRPDRSRADAVQLWNEPDNDDTASTGDQHAAYAKAAALGLADGRHRPVTVLSGIAGEDNGFQELMLQNGVTRYADAWSFHAYPDPAEQEEPTFPGSEEQHELRRAHGADGTEMWATEAGVFLDGGRDGYLTPDQQAVQARYLVQSTVEDLAAGTDRHFWFLGPPAFDGGIQFGLLSPDFQPLAAYSAHAAMAGLLGEATIVDRSIDLSSGTARFLFDAGDHAVTVVWAARPTEVTVPVPGTRVEVHDIMGRLTRTAAPSPGGTVQVEASPDPIYLVSDAPAPAPAPAAAAPAASETGGGGAEPRAGEPTPAERIVLSQRYDAVNAAPGKDDGDADPPLGYRLGGGPTRMSVDVYNFDGTARTVTVTGRAHRGWSVEPAGETTVEVPPMGRVGVPFTVTPGDEVAAGVDHPLVFEATVGGEPVPASVSRIQLPAAPAAPASTRSGSGAADRAHAPTGVAATLTVR